MNTLNDIRNGKSAARQLRSLAANNCLNDREFDRLLNAIDAGFVAAIPDPVTKPELTLHQGGRR